MNRILLRSLLLGMLEREELRQQAFQIICDSGDIALHSLAKTIDVKRDWREIEWQAKAETKRFLLIDSWDYWTKYDYGDG